MTTNTIRLSLSALILLFVFLFCAGVAGGVLGSRIFRTPVPLRSDSNGTIVPVSQQITISPSKVSADIVAEHSKSLFLLAYEDAKGTTAFGTGIALTNDGVIMSAEKPTKEPIVAIGEDGDVLPLTSIGYDELSGISFYKVSGKIVTPINLAGQPPRVGSSFLALSRLSDTTKISANTGTLSAIILPSDSAPGIQSLGQLDTNSTLYPGSALLDEEGNLIGALSSSQQKTSLLISDIRFALERLSSNNLSSNPFTSLGFTLSWETREDKNKKMHIQSIVGSVTNTSPADIAGLQVGDVVTAIGGSTVSLDTNIISLLTAKPLSFTIMRKEEQRTISFNP